MAVTTACPCLLVAPCHDRCTCVMPVSSSGCQRCCTYGSLEQRRAKAAFLVNAIDGATAYARPDHYSYTPEELAELTRDMTPEQREEMRIEEVTSPLFDMWLRFVDAFADRAIDHLDVTDADAEAAASKMGPEGLGGGYIFLLRRIADRRIMRRLGHEAAAVFATTDVTGGLSIEEIHERYAKLPKGDA